MIHRTHRFHGTKSLSFVFRQGQVVHAPGFSIKFIRNQRSNAYRAAVVVSRKVSKSAVVRNRIRRRIYEAVRTTEANIVDPYDIVFLVREPDLAKVKGRELINRVQQQLVRAGIIAQASAPEKNHAIVGQKEKDI